MASRAIKALRDDIAELEKKHNLTAESFFNKFMETDGYLRMLRHRLLAGKWQKVIKSGTSKAYRKFLVISTEGRDLNNLLNLIRFLASLEMTTLRSYL